MIPAADTNVIYVGDGETTVFPFSFKYAKSTDVKVSIYEISTDISTVLTKDYYVDTVARAVYYPGYPPGEEVAESEQPAILDSDHKIIIYRDTEISQPVDLGTKYPLEILETMHDRSTMQLQELAQVLDRVVKVQTGSETTPEELIQKIWDSTAAAEAAAQSAANSEGNASASENKAAESAESAKNDAESAKESALKANASELHAATSESNASQSENSAAKSRDEAQQILDGIGKIAGGISSVYDKTKTYNPTDQVMLPDGSIYRCIETSTGEYPPSSSKWIETALVAKSAFVPDDNSDLMLRLYAQADELFYVNTDEDIYPASIA